MHRIGYFTVLLPYMLFVLLAAPPATTQFAAAPGGPFAVGKAPVSVAVADFNGDGRADLVLANSSGNSVSVLLAIAAGGFAAASGSPVAVGANPQAVAVADFNGDGKVDFVTADLGSGTVTVMLGAGTGRFVAAAGSPVSIGFAPIFVAVGDFNGDGKTDIVTVNPAANGLTVLLGDGAGRFAMTAGGPIGVGLAPHTVAVGDLDGDGKQDLVVVNSAGNSLTVLLGDGVGGFAATSASPVTVGASPGALGMADLNGDGKLDLAVVNSGDNTVTVLLGDGLGGFAAAAGGPVSTGSQPSSISAGDFNGDGNQDLTISNAADNSITVLYGDGKGAFTAAPGSPFVSGANPASVAVGDFNVDGKPDVAVANAAGNSATVLLNGLPALTASATSLTLYATAGQTTPAAIPVRLTSSLTGSIYAAASDSSWLGPAPASSATGGSTTVSVSVNPVSPVALSAGTYKGRIRYTAPGFFGASTLVTLVVTTPSGTLQSGASWFAAGSNPQAIGVADLNSDGIPDIVTANYGGNGITVLIGDGLGSFAEIRGSPFGVGVNPASLGIADFNGDGRPDIAVANSGSNSVTILLGDGAGGFAAAPGSPYPVGSEPLSMTVGDFNGDGKPDVVTANNRSQTLTVLLGDGVGGFSMAPGSPVGVASSPVSIASGDLNGDGKLDLVTVNASTHTVTVLLGNGGGGFAAARGFPVGLFPESIVLADLNADGKLDIVTANSGDNTVTVELGDGTGSFSAATGSPFAVGNHPQSAIVLDVDGDGKPDILAGNLSNGTITALMGNGSGGFSTVAVGFPAGATPYSLAAGDFNGDGRPDVAVANVSASAVTVLLGQVAATTAVLSTPTSSVAYGTPIPITLRVTTPAGGFDAPAGTASFTDAGIALGTTAQSGSPYSFSARGLASGTHTLGAAYSGDGANASSASGTLSITVMPANQTISFGAIPNMAWQGTPLALSATVSSGLPVSFASTTTGICTVSGAAVTMIGAGTCTVEATQSGNADYNAAAPVDQSFKITTASQTITFGALSNLALGTGPATLSATASSGLAVSFASTTATICTVSGTSANLLSAGTCAIVATQAGNANWSAAASVTQRFQGTPGAQSITFGALADLAFGSASFTVNAVASSGLPVSFSSTTPLVCKLTAASVALVGIGTCTIGATQAGNANYAAAAPVGQSFSVTTGTQSITFSSLVDKPFGTPPITVGATASSGLAVTFASTSQAVCTVSGKNVTLVSGGTCTVEASQSGSTNYSAATPVDQSFAVTPGAQTIAFGALQNKAFGTSLTVTATASSGLPVSFGATTTQVCTAGSASITLVSIGTCTIMALQAGNASYAPAPSKSQSFQVTQASQTITFTGTVASQPLGTAPVSVSATASSGLVVDFASTTLAVCTVSGATVTLLTAGTCSIQATQSGNTNYAAAHPVSQSFTVTSGGQTIAFSPLQDQIAGGPSIALSATSSSGLTVAFASTTPKVCGVVGVTVKLITTGACTIQASQAGDKNYSAAVSVAQTFNITAAGPLIGSVLNAASYSQAALAPDGLAVTFGTNLASATAQATTSAFPTTLAGTNVDITDFGGATLPAPLWYVSPTQIDFLVPGGLAAGAATVSITVAGGGKVSFATSIARIAPSLFTADASGKGAPAAIALAYSGASPKVLPVFSCTGAPVICSATPIDLGVSSTKVFLELFGTGIRGRTGLSTVKVSLGGVDLQVPFAGPQGSYPGLDQVNVLLDRALAGKGALTLQLTVDGVAANPVTVNIK